MQVQLQALADTTDTTIDFVIARKFSTTDPNLTLGSEEITPNPTADWSFDEGQGQVAYDKTSNSNNGQLGSTSGSDANDPTWETEDQCVIGKCLLFNGSSNYVSLTPNLQTISQITISAWFNTNTATFPNSFRMLFSSSSGSSYLALAYTGASPFVSFDIGGTQHALNSNFTPLLNHWYYVTATYDGNFIRIYVDGILRNTSAQYTGTLNGFTSGAMYIGKYIAPGYEFSGKLDEVKIYPYARSADQVKVDYNGGAEVLGDQTQAYLSNGLVGYWKMDENTWGTPDCSTNIVLDSSGNSNNGKACPNASGPTGAAAGKFGNGGLFDGSNDYVDTGTSYESTFQDSYTFAFWTKPTDGHPAATQILAGTNPATNNIVKIFLNTDGTLAYQYQNNSIGTVAQTASAVFSDGPQSSWTHIAIVADANINGIGGLKIYVNGQSATLDGAATGDTSGITFSTYTNSNNFYFGARNSNGSPQNYYAGSFDDLRIYKRALSSSDVLSLYNWAPGPVLNYNLDENTGTTAHDTSGFNNNGTLTNGATWNAGKYGSGVSFDGVNDYIDTPDSSSLSLNSQITIDGWIKLVSGMSTSSTQKQTIVDSVDYNLYLDNADGKAHFDLNDSTADSLLATTDWNLGAIYGFDGIVGTMAYFNGALYVAGSFNAICGNATCDSGNITAHHIAKWNGSSWTAVGYGVSSTVYSIQVYNGELYLGGAFSSICGNATCDSGNITTNRIAKWNGSSFSTVSYGFNSSVRTFVTYNGELYLGGNFTVICGNTACNSGNVTTNSITKWNGSSFSTVGYGMNNPVYTVSIYDGKLILGGAFSSICGNTACNSGNVTTNYVARWDGSTFSTFGFGMNANPNSFEIYNGTLYTGGNFTAICGNTACNSGNTNTNFIAKWNGSSWTAVSYGLYNPFGRVDTLGVYNGKLYVSGTFTGICNDAACSSVTSANDLAAWDGSSWSLVGNGIEIGRSISYFINYNGNLYFSTNASYLCGNSTCDSGNIPIYNFGQIGTTNVKTVTSTTSSWNANTWYHIAATYNKSTIRLYVNGTLQGSATTSITIENTNNEFYIGKMHGSSYGQDWGGDIGESLFKGTLDNLYIYNYARTSSQIIEDMNGGHPIGGSPLESPAIHWKIDDMQGGTANNSGNLGSSFNGTISGGGWRNHDSCKVNGCYQFTGANDYIEKTGSTFFDGLTTMTASLWIKPQTFLFPDDAILAKRDASDNGFFIYTDHSNGSALRVGISNGATDVSNYCTTPTGILALSTWAHIAVVYDGSQDTNNRIKVYKNGNLVTCTATGTIPTALRTSTAPLRLGRSAFATQYGYYDEVKIYNVALTSDQVKIDMNNGASENFGSSGSSEAALLDDGAGNPPVGEWKMDENSGTVVADTSGNGHAGSVSGTTTSIWQQGKYGSSLKFNGSNNYISFGNYLGLTNTLTISMWVKPSSSQANAYATILRKSTTANTGYGIEQNNTTTNQYYFWYGNGSSLECATTYFSLTAGTWQNLEITKSGTAIIIYINGTAVNRCTATSGTVATNPDSFTLGSYSGGSARWWAGQQDDIKMYDYARTQSQVEYDYNRGAPFAWWKLNECQGSTAHDSTGNNYNGTITITATGGNTNGIGDCTTSTSAWGSGASGKYGSSLFFDGNGDYINTGNSFEKTFQSSYSLSMWVKPTDGHPSSPGSTFIGTSKSSGSLVNLILESNGKLRLQYGNETNSVNAETANAIFNDGQVTQWTQIVVTANANTNGPDGVKIYLNGVKQQLGTSIYSGDTTGLDFSLYSNTNNVYIGVRDSLGFPTTNWVSGPMDDIRIYNYALSSNQIQQLYNNGAAYFGL